MFDDLHERSPLPSQDDDAPAQGHRPTSSPGKASLTARLPSGAAGQPLPDDVRRMLEQIAGAPLDAVRIHTGSESAAGAEALGARAFAIGQDIHFAAGAYDPETPAGKHLLAHEVAHTIQQGDAARQPQAKQLDDEAGDGFETEADAFADAVVNDNLPAPRLSVGAAPAAPARKRREGLATDLAEAIFDPFAELKRHYGLRSQFGLSEGLAGWAENVFLGVGRTAEGLFAGADRKVEIGQENDDLLVLIGALVSKGPTWAISRLAAVVTLDAASRALANLSPENRAKLAESAKQSIGEKVLEKGLELIVMAVVKSLMTKYVLQAIASTELYASLSGALGLGPGVGGVVAKAGVPVILTFMQTYGMAQKASLARRRLQADRPTLYRALRHEDPPMDMAYFLVEDHMWKIDLAIRAKLVALALPGADWSF